MACDGCGAENRADASFCADCGSPLARHCPECAREVRAAARFCDGCGTALAAPPAAAVRKTVTALFADLGGSTGFGERVDAETARAVIGRYHALLQEVVDAHAGTVAKFIGDGMLAFFGIPEVAEDDAERAVAAAAAMQRRFAAFADEVEAAHGERLTFRIGVNSGEVVIGDGDADVVGDALNVAARLEKACEPGRVLVGEATWRLTRSRFGFEPLGEVDVAGRGEPVAAYVLAEAERPTDEATPFVGRDDELRRLRAALDDALTARAARFVTVIGPPGVGKTRLSRELEASVEEEARVLHTACERAGGSTFGPLVDLIRPALGGEATRESLAAIVPAAEAERDRVIDGLAGVVGLGEARSTEETFWALRRLVEALAVDQPLVLVVDDIQWAEARLLDLLEHLAEWVADAPVLLVGLARPELREVRPALAEPGRRVADVLVLDGLDPAATARLASEMLGGHGLPKELVARLPESTDGNPLFVRELVRMLVDEGVIRRDGDDWRLTVDADAVEVPPTIRSLLATRIERLPGAERTVLERASVVGPDFALGAVRALTDDDGSLESRLEALRRRDLVEPTGTYWGEEPVWRFHHVLIRDAVYGRLLKEARAELHERVGDWTAGAAPLVVGEHETTIAHHYEQAHAYRSQLGVLDDHGRELGQRAAGLLAVAARRSLAQDDLVAAASLATRALACLDDEAEERGELLLLAAEAILASGDLAQAPTVLEDLAALGAAHPDLAAWADAYRAQWLDLTDPSRLDEVERLADHATERFVESGDGSGQAKAHLVRASVLARRGRLADSEVELDRAMGAAREAKDRRRLVAALGAAPAVALWGPSPVARAGGRCLDVIRLLRITTQSPVVEATSLRHQAVLEALRGRFGPARTLLTDVRSTVEELGLRRDLMEVELFEGIVDLLDGDPASAEGHLRTAHEGLAALGAAAAGGAAALLARALLAQERIDEAEALAAAVGSTSGQDLKAAIAWGSVTAEIRAARGDAAEAVAAAEEAVTLAEGTDLVLDHADALAALARVRRTTSDAAGAELAEAEARRRYEAKGSTVHEGTPLTPMSERSGPEQPADRGPVGSRVENAVVRHNDELHARWEAGDTEAIVELLSPEVRQVDRRPGMRNEVVGRDAVLENMRVIADLTDTARPWRREVIATQGDRLALFRMVVTDDVFEASTVVLVELDAAGRQARSTFFDADDLQAAMAELEARHQALTPENLAARATRELTRGWLADGPDAVLDRYAPDCRIIDRRLGFASELVGREEAGSQLQVVSDLIGDGVLELEEVVAQRGDLLVLFRQTVGGDGYEVEMLSLVEVDADGRQVASTLYDLDQMSAAMAELEDRHQALAPENRAARLYSARVERWMAEGADAVAETISPAYRSVDRRVGFNHEVVGREAMVEQLRVTAELLGPSRWTIYELVAQRGEELALFRQGVADEYEVELLCLVEFDESDQQTRAAYFDVEDRSSAVAEMDRWHAARATDGTAPVDNLAARAHRGYAEQFFVEEEDAARVRYLPEVELVDHRSGLGAVLLGRDAVTANGRAMRALLEGLDVEIRVDVVAQRGDRLAVVGQGVSGEIDVEALALIEVDDTGRYRRIEWFDVDDLSEAIAALDRRHAELAGNRAAQLYLTLVDRWMVEGADAVVDLIAEDLHFEDRRAALGTVIHGRQAQLANMRAVDELRGESRFEHVEVVATRGERLVLVHQAMEGDVEVELLGLAEFDAEDRMVLTVLFDPDDLAGALEVLLERYLQGEGAPYKQEWTASTAFGRAIGAADDESLAALLTDDFTCVDHRLIGFGEMDRAELLEAVRTRPETVGVGTVVAAEVAVRPGLVLSAFEIRARSTTGGDQHHLGWSLIQVRDGQVDHFEAFDPDDRAAAEARFDELSSPTLPGPPVAGHEVENAAARQAREFVRRWTAEGADSIRPLFSAQIRNIDHRSGLTHVIEGIDEFVENLRATAELLGDNEYRLFEVVAERGDRLALLEQGVHGAVEVQLLIVNEVDAAGRSIQADTFDGDDLEAALDEMNRRYAVGEGRAFATEITTAGRAGRAIATGDADAFAALITNDFVCVDHRTIGRGERDRETFLAAVAARPDTLGRGAWMGREVRPRPGVVFTTYEIRTDADIVEVGVSVATLRGDRCDRLEVFAEDDRAAAEARFEDLVGRDREENRAAGQLTRVEVFPEHDRGPAEVRFAELSAAGTEENLTTQRIREQIRRWMVDGPESMRELVDDYRLVDHRLGMGSVIEGVDAFVANLRTVDGLRGEQEFEVFRVLAQRGQCLALVDQGFEGDLELHAYTVVEVDTTGRVVRGDIFDREDLADAVAELDRRYAAGEGSAYAEEILLASVFSQAVATGDSGALAPLLADDYVSIDHRLIGFGELDRETTLAAVAARGDTLGSGAIVSSEVRVRPGLVLAAYVVRTRSSAGSDLEDAAVSILQVSDGQVVHLELFDEGDWATAETRFEEQGRAAQENLAARRNREVIRRWMSDGPEAVRGLVTEDYHLADHRPGLTAEHAGVDALVDHLGAIDEVRGEQEFEVFRVVAQRGRRLALLDQGFDGDLVAHTYVVSEVDEAGRGVRVDGYEPEDLAAALAELDRRYLAGEGAEHPAVMTVMSEWTQLMARREWEATAALVSPDFRAVDHRSLGHGEIDFEQRLERDRILAESVPSAITFITEVLEVTERVGLLRGGWLDTGRDGSGFENWALVVLAVDDEGRFTRLEVFADDDLPAARARYEELRGPS